MGTCALMATLVAGAAALPCRRALAEDRDDSETAADITVAPIEVREQAPTPLGRGSESPDAATGLEDPAFVIAIHIDERAGETTSLADVLAKTMGGSVRSLGGLGSFSSISVRGGDPGHTLVLIDGVPLSRIAGTSVDLGRFAHEVIRVHERHRYIPSGRLATPVRSDSP